MCNHNNNTKHVTAYIQYVHQREIIKLHVELTVSI